MGIDHLSGSVINLMYPCPRLVGAGFFVEWRWPGRRLLVLAAWFQKRPRHLERGRSLWEIPPPRRNRSGNRRSGVRALGARPFYRIGCSSACGRIAAPVSAPGDCPGADVRLRAPMAAGSARPGLGFYDGAGGDSWGRSLFPGPAVPQSKKNCRR